MSELSRLAVVVVSYGDPALLERHATQVAAALRPARIVVVDNHSTDTHRTAVRRLCEREGWTGVFPGTNTGFGAGCNLGAAAALAEGAEVLLFVNPDATIGAESAVRLVAAVEAEPLLLAGPTVLGPDGSVASAGIDLDLDTGAMRPWRRRAEHPGAETLPWVTGACFAVTRELWERLAGFDERYFLYWEDVDLCARVRAFGGRVAVVDGATAVHAGGGTQRAEGSRAKSPAYYYFNIRNRALFARTWLSREREQAWRRGAVGAAYEILMRGGRRQLLRPVRPVSAVLRGLRDGRRDRPVRVLESVRELRATTNPYIVQLVETLGRRDDTEVVLFSFARAVAGRYDVFHVHWPELLLTSARTPLRRLARRLLTTAFITRLRLTRTPVVRTWHNLVRPDGLSRWDHRLLDALERRTRHVIRLTDQTAPPLDVPTSTIVHAHYRDWFEPVVDAFAEPVETVDRRVLYFGLIKPYKGVEQLLEAVTDSPEADLDVRLVGSPSDPALADQVRAAAAADARVSADLSYADDATLAAEIAAAALVVLPYRAMHNSGALLLALSLDTPVLAPDNEVNRLLVEEVGEGWLHLFEGGLGIEDLERALKAVAANPPAGRPDLSAREWPESAALHAAVFRASLYP
ncbi:Glycosyltransferase, GT2 family [Nocardioides sp. YR527]|uniref:glycosyltransferase n=1 Tax=Nocardioides sp. YR527 TaxID=1881028 RepID=UPI00089016D6|nr:glycosyltransferase [Nocardioides sp. YR527]SDK96382.1 Glycosyltransferase, GT2 family [Nocardioides sp. YR527]